jgi:hypothetical protein
MGRASLSGQRHLLLEQAAGAVKANVPVTMQEIGSEAH